MLMYARYIFELFAHLLEECKEVFIILTYFVTIMCTSNNVVLWYRCRVANERDNICIYLLESLVETKR